MTLALDKKGRLVAKRNKYGVSPKEERTVDGIVFASKREATRYRELRLMEQCGGICFLERQPRFKFPMGFSYVGDFQYCEHRKGPDIVEDVKGIETPVFRLKRKCMEYFYPDVELRVIK